MRTMYLDAALFSLYSNCTWEFYGEDYSGLVWKDDVVPKPTESELRTELNRLQAEYDDKEYDMLSIDFKKYKNCFIKIIIVKKINNKMFDDFVALLNSAEIYELSIAENFNTDEESKSADIDTTKDTISIINDEIDQMQNVPNKNKLKSIIHGLYLESLSQ